MKIRTQYEDGKTIVHLIGEGDLEASQEVKFHLTQLINEKKLPLILNLRRCYFLNSVFIGTLLVLTEKIEREHHKKLILIGLNKSNEKIIKTLGLNRYFILKSIKHREQVCSSKKFKKSRKSKLTIARHIYDSHVQLMNINKVNKKRFAPIVKLMHKELKELKRAG